MNILSEKDRKKGKILYIIECSLEYLISIAVGSVYLAKIANCIGLSDDVVGIMTSFVLIGNIVQLSGVFLKKILHKKLFILIFEGINTLLFSFLFFIPVLLMSQSNKQILFIIVFILAYISLGLTVPLKFKYMMEYVLPKEKGVYTGEREMSSLLSGIFFSLILGIIIDYFEKINNIDKGFLLIGFVIIFISIIHFLSIVFTKESNNEETQNESKKRLRDIFKNKVIYVLAIIFFLYQIEVYTTASFVGTYQTKELMFTTTYCSIIIIVSSIARIIFEIPMGKICDKYSSLTMFVICLLVQLLSYIICIFVVPSNGKYLFFIYSIVNGISMAGTNSAIKNMVLDYIKKEDQTVTFSVIFSISGVVSFLTITIVSVLVQHIQLNNNQFLGLAVYAQQITALISAIVTTILIIVLLICKKRITKNVILSENQLID